MNHIQLLWFSTLKKVSLCRKPGFTGVPLYRFSWQGKTIADAVRKDFDRPKKNGFLSVKEGQKP